MSLKKMYNQNECLVKLSFNKSYINYIFRLAFDLLFCRKDKILGQLFISF